MNEKLGKNGNQKLELELPKKKREKSQESQQTHLLSRPAFDRERPAHGEPMAPRTI